MNVERKHLTALVTGASSGIGRAFARELAKLGFAVVLVARREDRLREVAQKIEAELSVPAHVIIADLAEPEAPALIAEETARRGLTVDLLVSNAGFGVPGMLADAEWSRHRDSLQVMTVAPVQLAYLFAAGMAERGYGWIINVASLAALLPPHAGGTLYYPVKSFLLKFSLAHGEEMRAAGVNVTAVCPGFTETEFQVAAGGTVESVSLPRWLWLSPERVARQGCRAVMRGDAICIPGRINRLIALAFKLLPGKLGRWIMRSKS